MATEVSAAPRLGATIRRPRIAAAAARVHPTHLSIVIASAVFALLCRSILGSDLRVFLVDRIQDDSYYYIQPAWLLPQAGHFTFDGIHRTYGFQPLWMLVLSVVRIGTPTKDGLTIASLLLGAALYCATGVVLYRLARRWWGGWLALIPAAIWLINPVLAATFVSGKENALAACLLAASLLSLDELLSRAEIGRRRWLAYGVLIGLLSLARVNMAPFALLSILAVALLRRRRGLSVQGIGAALLAIVVVGLPWCLYAQCEFGTVMPTSGACKLIGVPGALAASAGRHLGIDEASIAPLVPAGERPFMHAGDMLLSGAGVVRYAAVQVPSMALKSWRFGLLLFGLALFIGVGVTVRRRTKAEAGKAATVLWMLAFVALCNSGLNLLLLGPYVQYATWYAVPELLAWTLLASAALVWLAQRATGAKPLLAAAAVLALGLQGSHLVRAEQPARGWAATPRAYMPEARSAAAWIDGHLPAGARIGSFNSGLLGYSVRGSSVTNLDGLANSPEFVKGVVPGALLYKQGLASENVMLSYLERERIEYIADAEREQRIGTGPAFGVVPAGRYEVFYRGGPVDFDSAHAGLRFVVIHMLPARNGGDPASARPQRMIAAGR